ncbi:MAG: DUF58 domain-containing protein [Myxococcota bacterium]
MEIRTQEPNDIGISPPSPDAELLAEVENLQLLSRQAAQGALAGSHRSLRRGSSIEFSEHKVYTPGDDVRHIDWRAFAKTDRFHVKQYEDETNLRVEILLDHSGSMAFTSAESRYTKLAYAKVIAGALSYLALRQGDALGLLTFAAEVSSELPARASSSHLLEVMTRLAQLSASDTTGIVHSLDHFAQSRRVRTVSVVISDLFDPNPELLTAFRRLCARRHDVAVFHILDAAEIDFPYDNPAFFSSMEDSRRLFVHPRTLRHAYTTEMRRFLSQTARSMSEVGIDYHCVRTDQPAAGILGEFLRRRAHAR